TRKGKKTRRVNEDGDEVFEDDPDDVEEVMKREQERLDQEKKNILNDKNLIASEKDKLLKEMKDKEKELEREQEAKIQMMSKLKAMESKLLSGKNIVDHTNEQERRLAEKRAILAEEKRKEREIQQLLEKEEENVIEKNEGYINLQQEVDYKTKKLKKFFAKFQQLKEEIKDLNEANSKERQELEQTQTDLMKDIKLRQLIIENFVPKEEKEKLLTRLYFDANEDKWKHKVITKESTKSQHEIQMAKRPISAYELNRAVTNFARSAAQSLNPRFMGENVLFLELDLPNRTTRDYESPTLAPHLQAALDTALKDEDEIEIDNSAALKLCLLIYKLFFTLIWIYFKYNSIMKLEAYSNLDKIKSKTKKSGRKKKQSMRNYDD
ncbi:kinesin KIF3B, partial [Brachionus plicatilis]